VPRVSVIIPARDHARFLGEALDSVLAQTFQDLEVLVVDDGSTDETASVVTAYAPPVRYHYQTHGGVSRARNEGLRQTQGSYVAFLDADDTWAPAKLERQVAFLDAHPRVGVVFTSYYLTDETGRPFAIEPRRFPYRCRPFERLLIWPYGGMNVAMVRRACFDRVGAFAESLTAGEDWDLWLRVSQHFEFANLDEPLATYRQMPSAARAARRATGPDSFRCVLDGLFADETRLQGYSQEWRRRWQRRAYASLEITVALMGHGSPFGHVLAAARQSLAALALRWRAVAFLLLGSARVPAIRGRLAQVGRAKGTRL